MDIAVLLSGFSGLVAAFVASAIWATRPTQTAISSDRVVTLERSRTGQRR
jgi:hypothetical protein